METAPDDRESRGERFDAGLAEAFGRREPAASPSVLARLETAGTPVRRLLLRDTNDPAAPAGVVRARPVEVAARAEGRYQVLGEIARGGIGVVWKSHDVDLGRDVAMKVLREEYADRADVVERFVEEAQIGGQLQHPGIVPVYELGLSADRRPFFSMKLVKGRTLAALLADRKDVADDLRRHLATFEAVCQTLGYAHSRGVIHRDVKPANVMVGAFGEVQVVDWGLAKVLGQGGVADERRAKHEAQSVIETVRSEGSGSASVVGSVYGTPRYMSPEQARGEVEKLDARTDVFSLGAVLCEVLTGVPPYDGDDAEALLQAAKGRLDPAFERLDGSGADPDLVTLAKECLAPAKKARPKDGGAVAARMGAHFATVAERARDAEIEIAEARVATQEERRRRKLSLALAAAIGVLLLGGAGAWLFAEHAARQRAEDAKVRADEKSAHEAETRRHAEEALGRTEAVRAKVEEALREADLLGERALATSEPKDAVPIWHDAVAAAARAGAAAASKDATDALRAKVAAAAKTFRESEATAAKAAADRQRDRRMKYFLQELQHTAGSSAPAEQEARFAALFREFGLDPDAKPAAWEAVLVKTTIRSNLAAGIENWMDARERAGQPLEPLPAFLEHVDDDPFRARRRAAKTLAELHALADEVRETDRYGHILGLAIALRRRGDAEAALRLAEKAVSLSTDSFGPRMVAAGCALELRPPAFALAIQHLGAATSLYPQSEAACDQLGYALLESGDPRAAVDITTAHLRANPKAPNAWVRTRRASANRILGNLAEAEEDVRQVLASDPAAQGARLELALVLVGRGDLEAAEAEAREAIRRNPKAAGAYRVLGTVLFRQQDDEDAAEAYRQAISLEPTNGEAHSKLGIVLRHLGRFPEALSAHDEAVRLRPDVAGYQAARSSCLHSMRRDEEAIAAANEALRINPRDGFAWNDLGLAHWSLGKLDAARGAFRMSAHLRPESTTALRNLALIHGSEGDAAKCLEILREAVRRAPEHSKIRDSLGIALSNVRRWEEALEEFRRATELDPSSAVPRTHLAAMLLHAGRFAEGLEQAQEAVRLARNPAEERGAEYARWQHETCLSQGERLIAIATGKAKPKDADERVLAAHVAQWTGLEVAAATQWALAMKEKPDLAEDWVKVYDAACAAARAGSGSGPEGAALDEKGKAAWRERALEWVTATFALRRAAHAEGDKDALGSILRLRVDPDFHGVRDPAAIAALPDAERTKWWAIWAEIRIATGPWKPPGTDVER